MTSQLVRFKKRIEKIKKRSLVKISWLRNDFISNKEKRSNSSKISSISEQKPNFTLENGHCA
jgi:hypothetical protein